MIRRKGSILLFEKFFGIIQHDEQTFTLILTQNLGFNTTINLTRNWRVTVTSAYDFVNKELARTTININRDLHCWEMLFNIVPNGAYQNYSFELRVKSSVLQDLKLTRKRRWQDL